MGDLRDAVLAYLKALDKSDELWWLDGPAKKPLDEQIRDGEIARSALRALRVAVATPPDTGWRPRPPTAAEVIAHHAAHGGVWLADGDPPPDGTGWLDIVYIEPGDDIRWMDGLGMWRPLTASGDSAPWPEVTP